MREAQRNYDCAQLADEFTLRQWSHLNLLVSISIHQSHMTWHTQPRTSTHLLTANSLYSIYPSHLLELHSLNRPSNPGSSLFICLHLLPPVPPPPSIAGTHCGYLIPPVIVSASDTISVTFQSDSRLTDRGFSASWEAVYPEDIAGTKDTCVHNTYTHKPEHTHICWSSSTPH